ncbi:MAG: hypothetical protein J5640_00155, partial [Bacteroidales bacterium]|nr:hypothetical protein [Bacteroidales bacterium]
GIDNNASEILRNLPSLDELRRPDNAASAPLNLKLFVIEVDGGRPVQAKQMRQIEAHIALSQRINGMPYDKVFCHNLLQDTKKRPLSEILVQISAKVETIHPKKTITFVKGITQNDICKTLITKPQPA